MVLKKKEIIKHCVIGIPDHQGVFHVGGRLGAQSGPAAFRKHFFKMKSQVNVWEKCSDLGDVGPIKSSVRENLERASQMIEAAHGSFRKVLVVGGGHDHGYSQLKGLKLALGKRARIGCMNIDAHLDVRKPSPHVTSGSPFYLALEEGLIRGKDFVEFGIQEHANAPELFTYVKAHGAKVVLLRDLRFGNAVQVFKRELSRLVKTCDHVALSVDLDAFAAAFAPGVSAPQAEGFSPSDGLQMVEFAGSLKKVSSLGLFELNPEHDLGSSTALLTATLGFHFLESAS